MTPRAFTQLMNQDLRNYSDAVISVERIDENQPGAMTRITLTFAPWSSTWEAGFCEEPEIEYFEFMAAIQDRVMGDLHLVWPSCPVDQSLMGPAGANEDSLAWVCEHGHTYAAGSLASYSKEADR